MKALSILLLAIVVFVLVLALRRLVTAIVAFVKKNKAGNSTAPGTQEESAIYVVDTQASAEQTQDKSIEKEEKH